MVNNLTNEELIDLYFAHIVCSEDESPFSRAIKEINALSDKYADAYTIVSQDIHDKNVSLIAKTRLSIVIEIIESAYFQQSVMSRLIENIWSNNDAQ